MVKLLAWLQAARLPSQTYIFFPLLLGQSIAAAQTGQLNWGVFVLVHCFGLFDQLYIVFANDVADVAGNQGNSTYTIVSGGSRVLVEGKLTTKQLSRGARVSAALAFVVSLLLIVRSPWLPALPRTSTHATRSNSSASA